MVKFSVTTHTGIRIAYICSNWIQTKIDSCCLELAHDFEGVWVTTMENLHQLLSCLMRSAGKGEQLRMIEDPTEIQDQILKVFGYAVRTGRVLLRQESLVRGEGGTDAF